MALADRSGEVQRVPLDDRFAERGNSEIAGRPDLISGNRQIVFGGLTRAPSLAMVNTRSESAMKEAGPGVLVDSNVLLDVFTEDPTWFAWSSAALEEQAERAVLVINPIIYAEVSVRFARIEELETALPSDVFRRESLPWEAGFLVGKCFVNYWRRGGAKRAFTGLLPWSTCGRAQAGTADARREPVPIILS